MLSVTLSKKKKTIIENTQLWHKKDEFVKRYNNLWMENNRLEYTNKKKKGIRPECVIKHKCEHECNYFPVTIYTIIFC